MVEVDRKFYPFEKSSASPIYCAVPLGAGSRGKTEIDRCEILRSRLPGVVDVDSIGGIVYNARIGLVVPEIGKVVPIDFLADTPSILGTSSPIEFDLARLMIHAYTWTSELAKLGLLERVVEEGRNVFWRPAEGFEGVLSGLGLVLSEKKQSRSYVSFPQIYGESQSNLHYDRFLRRSGRWHLPSQQDFFDDHMEAGTCPPLLIPFDEERLRSLGALFHRPIFATFT